MRQRSGVVGLVVAGLVLGLGVGSVGTAVAGPAVTTNLVKRIAAKVVKKKAKKLSVAHAATAGDAATLDGLDGNALKTFEYHYTLPVDTTPGGGHNYTFPGLPAGTYLASYSVLVNAGSATATAICNFADPPHWFAGAQSYGAHNGVFASMGGSATETVDASLQLHCVSTSGFELTSSDVTFLRVDTVTEKGTASP